MNASLSDTNTHLNVGNQSFVADLAGVRGFYASGNFVKRHPNKSYSFMGASVINSQFGPLINDMQARLRYSHRLFLSSNLQMGAGIEFGFVNIFFEGTPNTIGGSDLAPDLNLLLAIFGQRWKLGASLNHVTSPSVRPIQEEFSYERHLNLHGEYIFKLSQNLKLLSAYQSILLKSDYLFRGNLTASYYDRFELGAGIRNEGFTLNCGITGLNIKPLDLSLRLGYRVPILNSVLNRAHLFQVHLGVGFKK